MGTRGDWRFTQDDLMTMVKSTETLLDEEQNGLIQKPDNVFPLSGNARQRKQEGESGSHRLYDMLMHAPAFFAVLSGPGLRFELANFPYRLLVGKVVIWLNVRRNLSVDCLCVEH